MLPYYSTFSLEFEKKSMALKGVVFLHPFSSEFRNSWLGLRHTKLLEILPFIPTMDLIDTNLVCDATTNTLLYIIEGKTCSSDWKILYANTMIVAGKASVTGYSILRRI